MRRGCGCTLEDMHVNVRVCMRVSKRVVRMLSCYEKAKQMLCFKN